MMGYRLQAHCHTRYRGRGFILITVLVVLVLLSALLLRVFRQGMQSLAVAAERPARFQARQNALSGCDIACGALRENPDLLTEMKLSFHGPREITMDEGRCLITIEDESGKLPINAIKNEAGQLDRFIVNQLLRLVDRINSASGRSLANYAFVPCLIDWIDADQEKTVLPWVATDNTGWDPVDSTSDTPCGNRPFEILSELNRVKGITPAIYQGQDMTGRKTWHFPGLEGLLTVHYTGKLNINTANPWLLFTLDEEISVDQIETILAYRQSQPFGSLEEFRSVCGLSADRFATIAVRLTVKPESRVYRIQSKGICGKEESQGTMIIKLKTDTGGWSILEYKEN